MSVHFQQTKIEDRSLENIYKSGKVRFIQDLVLSNETRGGKDVFESPIDIAEDEMGDIYVSDSRAGNVKMFDSKGNYRRKIGARGQGPGELKRRYEPRRP